jgi:hypothetical protein
MQTPQILRKTGIGSTDRTDLHSCFSEISNLMHMRIGRKNYFNKIPNSRHYITESLKLLISHY